MTERTPENMTTDYRPGPLICPLCGGILRLTVPGFDLDRVPPKEITLWLTCAPPCQKRLRVISTTRIVVDDEKESRAVWWADEVDVDDRQVPSVRDTQEKLVKAIKEAYNKPPPEVGG